MKLKALIVDDDSEVAHALQLMITKTCPEVEITGICNSAIEAAKFLKRNTVDILFLDIEMPGGSGFDALEIIDTERLHIIFTTAHSEYAIRAIKKGAKDYLLKPVDPDDLVAAVQKVKRTLDRPVQKTHETISIHVNNELVFLGKEEVMYFKADGRYTDVFCSNGRKYSVCKNIGEFEEELGTDLFFRVHKSYLINCRQVQKINSIDGGFVVMNDRTEIEISKRKKSDFLKFIK